MCDLSKHLLLFIEWYFLNKLHFGLQMISYTANFISTKVVSLSSDGKITEEIFEFQLFVQCF